MTPLDKNYLSLQFRNKIHTLKGSSFQSFFEDIMERAFSDFQKIRPYGKEGDGGNDGFRRRPGYYYQVYAPDTPVIRESEASNKLSNDFEKLKKNWGDIAEIKKYYFVYNDKNVGSTQKLESAITQLEQDNPNIEFNIFSAKKLEGIFFTLEETDILALGFDIDSRKAVSNAYEYLNQVKLELDRENVNFAFKIHSQIENIIKSLQDDKLEFEYDLLKSSCLQKLERIREADELYQNLSKRYPNDPRPRLHLAELSLFDKNYEKNKLILADVDQTFWLSKLQKLVRKSILGEELDISLVDERTFPEEPKIKSSFYRLYSLFFEKAGDIIKADSFIEKAIHLHPNRFTNYAVKLSLIEKRIFSSINDNPNLKSDLNNFLSEIDKVEKYFSVLGDLTNRSKASLLIKKLNVYRAQENVIEFEALIILIFDLIIDCYFDLHIEAMLTSLLWGIHLPKGKFDELLKYLMNTKVEISEHLLQQLIIQFNYHNCLFSDGKKFFSSKNNTRYLSFIEDVEKKEYLKIINFLNDQVAFAVAFTESIRSLPELRKGIIESLPADIYKSKNMLLLLLHYDEEDYDKAFDIINSLDLSYLNYFESRLILQIVQKKKAWDLEVVLIEKLLGYEKDPKIIHNLKLQLFNANFNLENYLEVIKVGDEILAEQANKNELNQKNNEAILARTIQACLKRGSENKAYELLNSYKQLSITPEFKVSIESEVFLKNNLPYDALTAVVIAVKIKKRLSPEEYASLFYVLTQIDNLLSDFNLESSKSIESDCFIKLKNQERWYYLGEGNELDSSKITPSDDMYNHFIDKPIGGLIDYQMKYSSQKILDVIQFIFPIEKYIYWQSLHHFENLAREGRWDGARMIDVPPNDESIDTSYLLEFFQDEDRKRQPLFEMYCNTNIPLALLALNDGGLQRALGHIQQENKGFVKLSSGSLSDLENQKRIASKMIDNELPFFIDGTSALFLSEIGLLKKIYNYIPKVRVPQSVIAMLLNVMNRFRLTPHEKGSLGYAQGHLVYSTIDPEKSLYIQNNFKFSIELLESETKNVLSISQASKFDCLSESKIPPELCDACILAQKESIPILTDDFLYLQLNAIETKKKSPDYFSSLILIRVLYEKNKLNFDEYLEYFGYLSSYRARFLYLNPDDIYKAVFGDNEILRVRPDFIRKLNFPLTLSEDYGVPFETAFNVIVTFLVKIIIDDSIAYDVVERIYIEILISFPTNKGKNDFGRILLGVSSNIITRSTKVIPSLTIREKIDMLAKLTEIYKYDNKLWLPNTL